MDTYRIGGHVVREEDAVLLRGRGRYVDDVRLPGEARGFVLRSPHAHARIRSVDLAPAKAAPGVLAVLAGDDLRKRGLGTHRPVTPRRRRNGQPAYVCSQPLLAQARVRYVGEPVAFVVAETLAQAKDAAELIEVAYEPLPAVTNVEAALAPGAPALWDDNPGNEAFVFEQGNKEAVEAAFNTADRIVRDRIVINRITANSMEPRGCLAEYDSAEDRYTVRCTVQSVHMTRSALAGAIFKQPEHKFRVVCDNMGGGFGMKGNCSAEYALSLWAAEVTGRPVKWISERSEGILTDDQARGSVVEAELALDKNARFLALRTRFLSSIGAYFTTERPCIPLTVGMGCLNNTYAFPAIYSEVVAVLTNIMMTAPYRGGSRPEPLFVIETMVDKAARELKIDPAELRRRNTVPASAMPYTTAMRQVYDCGDFVGNLDDCVARSDYAGVAERRAEAKRRGKILGVGVASACAPSGGQGFEHVDIRFDPSGGVTLLAGSMDHGQGHATTFKQILADKLGIDPRLVRYRFGDTDLVSMGIGTFGSRSAILAGSAIVVAAGQIVDKGRRIAAHLMEAAADDVVFEVVDGGHGRFKIAGTDRSMDLGEVARKSFHIDQLPKGMEVGLSAQSNFGNNQTATFACGFHVCEVEVDPDTGKVALVRYVAVDDVGTVLNPLLCDGQIYGGIGQGAGQALLENLIYDDSGQCVTASFMDYCMPRADDFCDFDLAFRPVPTAKNPLGVKGAGEAGTVSAIPAIVNAVNDALAQIGAPPVAMPTTPEKVWRALRAAAR